MSNFVRSLKKNNLSGDIPVIWEKMSFTAEAKLILSAYIDDQILNKISAVFFLC